MIAVRRRKFVPELYLILTKLWNYCYSYSYMYLTNIQISGDIFFYAKRVVLYELFKLLFRRKYPNNYIQFRHKSRIFVWLVNYKFIHTYMRISKWQIVNLIIKIPHTNQLASSKQQTTSVCCTESGPKYKQCTKEKVYGKF